jgi:cell division septal protein FtsQ
MKLKPQPKPKPMRAPRRPSRGAARPSARRGARGMAKRPGVPLRQRIRGRLPSLQRAGAVLGAVASAAALVALLNGPWLRVADVAWAGERYTDPHSIADLLEGQRGASVLGVDTDALRQRLERIPSIADATVSAGLGGRLEATVTEREVAFVWVTTFGRFLGSADGTIFASLPADAALPDALAGMPQVTDDRFAARVVSVGDRIPDALLATALRLEALDPALLGSAASSFSVSVDDEYGFRLASSDPAWEIALGVYGVDPTETREEMDARIERQITAVRTLFASRPEAEIGWVDVRNPGKVYFRAKG